jgi:hypothetical protein
MTRLTLANEQVRIYDDVLPAELFRAVLDVVTTDRYRIVHKNRWRKVWRPGDGLPLQGTTTYFRPDPSLYGEDETPRYPTGTPLDPLIGRVTELAGGSAGVIGGAGTAWSAMTIAPWIYPVGAGLSLHRDRCYAGSFAYFVHHEWNFHWGGQWLILDPRTAAEADPDASPLYPHWLSDEDENRAAMEPGLATSVVPKPNRLVFIAPDAYRMITHVDGNAGSHPHVVLAGFFLLPDTA